MRLYKRGGVYWCRVRDARGVKVRKSTGCTDYQAAEIAARSFEREAVDPDYAAAKASTLGDAVTAYFAELRRRGNSAATLDIAETKCGHLVRVWKEELPLIHVTAKRVDEYIDKRAGEGAKPLTIKKELGALKGLLDVAKHQGSWFGDVAKVLPLRYGGKHTPRKRWLTKLEVVALLSELSPHRAAHVAFIIATGARLGESLRAEKRDVDFGRGLVHIRGTKTVSAEDDVPITPLTEALLRYALEHGRNKPTLFRPWGKLHRDVIAACERAGIDKCGPNDFRRTFGTWHRMAGIAPNVLALMLRHTTDKLAQTTYAKLRGDELAGIVRGQLKSASLTVPDLCSPHEKNDTNANELEDSFQGIQAPPGEIESPANGLGIRSTSQGRSARKQALSPALARVAAAMNVPILNGDKPADSDPPGVAKCRLDLGPISSQRDAEEEQWLAAEAGEVR